MSESLQLPDVPKPKIKLATVGGLPDKIWDADRLDRSRFAKTLREMICEEQEPLVVAVNGKWGSGKTFFLERFGKEYESSKIKGVYVYLNAWECDYLSNPLFYLFSGLDEAAKRHPDIAILDDASWKTCKDIVECIGWNIVHRVSFGLADGLDDVVKGHPLEMYGKQVLLVTQIKDYLKRLAQKVRNKTELPLIICVDELDRCRPTYAIEMLERIKHLFNVPGIVFLLGMDRVQLCRSIQATYGDIDTDNYLHRFIDLEFVLPEPDREKFLEDLWDRYNLGNYLAKMDYDANGGLRVSEGGNFRQIFLLFAESMQLALREIEIALKWFIVVVREVDANGYSFPVYVAILILMRLRNRGLYVRYVSGKATVKDVLDFLFPIDSEMLAEKDPWAFESVISTVYTSYSCRRRHNPVLDRLKTQATAKATDERVRSKMPIIFQSMPNYQLGELIKKIEEESRRIGFSCTYTRETLEHVVRMLEVFEK